MKKPTKETLSPQPIVKEIKLAEDHGSMLSTDFMRYQQMAAHLESAASLEEIRGIVDKYTGFELQEHPQGHAWVITFDMQHSISTRQKSGIPLEIAYLYLHS